MRLVDTGNSVGSAGQIENVVGGEVGDDLPETEGNDREIVASEAQSRCTQDSAEHRRHSRPEKDEHPERQMDVVDRRRERCACIATDGEERRVSQVEQTGEPDDDVEAQGEQHVDGKRPGCPEQEIGRLVKHQR